MKRILLSLSLLLATVAGVTVKGVAATSTTHDSAPQIGAQVFIEPGQSDAQIDGWFRTLKESNMTLARIRMFERYMHKGDGSWDFSLFDRAFRAADKYGIELYATLFPHTDYEDTGGFKFPRSDEHADSVMRYIQNVVTHFKNYKCLKAWVLMNEPGASMAPFDEPFTAAKYKEWLKNNADADYNKTGYPVLEFNRERFTLWYHTWYIDRLAQEVRKYDTKSELADISTGYATFNYGSAYWQSYYYGVVGGIYGSQTFSGIPGYARSTTINGMTNYVHVNNNITATYDWTAVNNYRTTTGNGLTVIFADYSSTAAIAGLNSATSPLFNCGYVIGNSGAGPYTSSLTTDPTATGTKIYHFLTNKGYNPITTITTTFGGDGTSTRATTLPPSAVAMLVTADGARLVVDPLNNIIYIGECQQFEGGNLSGNRWQFIDNLMYYIANAAKYGTNFTDMFIENGQPGAVPAPWDPIWGANAGVPDK